MSSQQGRTLPPEARAMVWVLAEQGLSHRQIATRVQTKEMTVYRILHENPSDYAALVARLREQASRKWKRLADKGASTALKWVKMLDELGDKGVDGLDERDLAKLERIPNTVRALITAAEGGEKWHQLLTGGVTDRKEEAKRINVQVEHKADEIIRRAIEMKVTDKLPEPLRVEAEKRMLEARDPSLARVVVDQPPP